MRKTTAILLFAFIFLSPIHFVAAQDESAAGSILSMIQNVLGPVLTAGFWQNIATDPNSQALILVKVMLWLFIFFILYPIAQKIPFFSEKKSAAGVAVGVLAFIGVAPIPGQIIATITAEYSGIATVVILAIPIVGAFLLSRELPDSRSGNIFKFMLFALMLALIFFIKARVGGLGVGFMQAIFTSSWFYLFLLIVFIITVYYGYKAFFPGGGEGWGGDGSRSVFSRGGRGALFGGSGAARTLAGGPGAQHGVVQAEQQAVQTVGGGLGRFGTGFEEEIVKLSDNEIKQTDEQVRLLQSIQQAILTVSTLMKDRDLLRQGTTSDAGMKQIVQYTNQINEKEAELRGELARLSEIFKELQKELDLEAGGLAKENESIDSLKYKIQFFRIKVEEIIPIKNALRQEAETAYKNLKNEEDKRIKGKEIEELRASIDALNNIKTLIATSLTAQLNKLTEKLSEVKSKIDGTRTSVNEDIKDIQKSLDEMSAGKYQAAVDLLTAVINRCGKRKLYIQEKENISKTMKESIQPLESQLQVSYAQFVELTKKEEKSVIRYGEIVVPAWKK